MTSLATERTTIDMPLHGDRDASATVALSAAAMARVGLSALRPDAASRDPERAAWRRPNPVFHWG